MAGASTSTGACGAWSAFVDAAVVAGFLAAGCRTAGFFFAAALAVVAVPAVVAVFFAAGFRAAGFFTAVAGASTGDDDVP
jgi:hypothetical protein